MIQKPSKYLKKPAFSLLELIFVIVIIGILGKFGVELMAKAYENYIFTKINNTLQNQSGSAVEFIAKRLSYRIPDSVIGRVSASDYDGVQDLDTTKNYRVLEWVSFDIDGWRGVNAPYWSGIADLNASSNSFITTPETNVTAINNTIGTLSQANSGILDSALYFIGSNSDVHTGYGWDGNVTLSGLGATMHPITAAINNRLSANFAGVDLYEYYKIAWTANAIAIEDDGKGNNTYDLVYYYDYQPWDAERYSDAGKNIKRAVIMENVPTFQFRAVGSMLKIQVCVKSELTDGAHAICKEKTVF
ncbi:type II secretion system protein [Sulfurimonas sp.]|uniref:type II secretion system protein n=1 Tax=Sulfurimonas sp. TaxID=2022749 RepID=UPI00356629B1